MLDFKHHDGGAASAGTDPFAGDCVVRALSITTAKALGRNITGRWYATWWERCHRIAETICYIYHTHQNSEEYVECVSPNAGNYTDIVAAAIGLREELCPRTSLRFTHIPMHGSNLIAIQGHVLAVIDGTIYDTHDWGDQMLPIERLWRVRKEDIQL